MDQVKKRPRQSKSLSDLQKTPSQKRTMPQKMNKHLSEVLLFVATLTLLGFAIYWKSDSPAFYTFLSATLAYVFGRRLGN